jgi:hypothetical protein
MPPLSERAIFNNYSDQLFGEKELGRVVEEEGQRERYGEK